MRSIGTIEKLAEMDTPAQAPSAAGIFNWQIPGKQVSVQLSLDVIDSILPEMMRAFGAVPKRGAEVGGLLIGSTERVQDGQTIVRVEKVELVPCLYARGPSYQLTDEDRAAFEEARERWAPDSSRPLCAVGYFRSHTRDGLSLTQEDLELLDRYFPDPAHIALLIRPFVTKPVQAGFFFRENGSFPAETPLPFVFSKRQLGGESLPTRPVEVRRSEPQAAKPAPAESVNQESSQERQDDRGSPRRVIPLPDDFGDGAPTPLPETLAVKPAAAPARAGLPAWVWIPLSFALLVIGALGGLMAPKYINLAALTGNPDEFSLGLTVSQIGENLTVRWNTVAPAIQSAQSGVLEIEDAGYSKPVDLDSTHLQGGSLIYRNTAPYVRFRLTVHESGRASVTETTVWSQ